jgi:dTDP-4-amino-4,6-dideoxygalactose transaminase
MPEHLTDEISKIIRAVASSEQLILGQNVRRLELEVARKYGREAAVACASGTAALVLVLIALGVGEADEVIVETPKAWAWADAVWFTGALPVFVAAGTRGPGASSPRTRAVIVSGTADAESRPAQAPPVIRVVGLADATARPHPDEMLVLTSDEGAVAGIGECALIVADGELAARCRRLRNHGQDGVTRFLHHDAGFNARMDEITAAFLLPRIEETAGAR